MAYRTAPLPMTLGDLKATLLHCEPFQMQLFVQLHVQQLTNLRHPASRGPSAIAERRLSNVCDTACAAAAAEDDARADAGQRRQPESTDQQQLETVDAGKLSTGANEHQLQQPGMISSACNSVFHSQLEALGQCIPPPRHVLPVPPSGESL